MITLNPNFLNLLPLNWGNQDMATAGSQVRWGLSPKDLLKIAVIGLAGGMVRGLLGLIGGVIPGLN